ncbi:glycosyltransferase N-terminal domain-containing protein [Rickettsia endosymbiont of Cardiosporidium cionae]|uniref:glycosyltransferase N-terminal domain-containing protein n=1 Tax=Rickettsia endosymbiont of Cardiosporidium cionae TaxID=2777155 RepID=UPI0018932671|nr:glycosyltransferase N-terminal domain-containing protein [Rickettsia endosymbiont of Cardiosporidium cionae]KAF8818857.1 3-deoxy-D-manno-octulosonic acid transferase [Rickettsia endosymbiont of Cardiosporidium cionae]
MILPNPRDTKISLKICLVIYNIIYTMLLPSIILIRLLQKSDTYRSVLFRMMIKTNNNPTTKQEKLIWFNAASIGESKIAINLIEKISIDYPNIKFLITTSTIETNQNIKNILPKNTLHQLLPVDLIFVIKKFLNHYKPNLGIFIESELWPSLIHEASDKCDLLLINAKISDKSFKKWRYAKSIFRYMMNNFKEKLVQSKIDLKRFEELGGKNYKYLDSLKFCNKKLPVNLSYITQIKKNISKNKVILVAASTHTADEVELLHMLYNIKKEIFLIIVPRHPDQKKTIINLSNKLGLIFTMQSKNHLPNISQDLYIADSFYQLGNFYSLADLIFIGGSFKDGGHNIIEAMNFRKIIFVGPKMYNFQEITDEMIKKNAVISIKNREELQQKIIKFIQNKDDTKYQKLLFNAESILENKKQTFDNYLDIIKKYIKST